MENGKTLKTIGTQFLTWDGHSKTFSAEASDLNWPPGKVPRQVNVKSSRTGVIKVFALRGKEVDLEDEVVAYLYECEGMSLRVHND